MLLVFDFFKEKDTHKQGSDSTIGDTYRETRVSWRAGFSLEDKGGQRAAVRGDASESKLLLVSPPSTY